MNQPSPMAKWNSRTDPSPCLPILTVILVYLIAQFVCGTATAAEAGSLGQFQAHGDIGSTGHTGATDYDPLSENYRVTGAGENMWFEKDAFQFAWRQVSGDARIAASIHWPGGLFP